MGGFSQCFSSGNICRFCHIKYTDLQSDIEDYESYQFDPWTVEDYDKAVEVIEKRMKQSNICYSSSSDTSDDSATEEDNCYENLQLYGLKHRCPFNVLKSFHCINGFQPDVLHDLFEGVISQDLLGCIRILAVKGWFSIDEYNVALKNLSLKSSESSDRPEIVPSNNKVKKLVGKAVSIWKHIRYFPILIRPFVKDKEETALKLVLQLHELVERIVAPRIREYEIDTLRQRIFECLNSRSLLFMDYPDLLGTMKPKTHLLCHYPEAIVNFGPPINYWTARYESRHRIGKSTADSAKNFKVTIFYIS